MIHQLIDESSLGIRSKGAFESPVIPIPDRAVDDPSAVGEIVCSLLMADAEWLNNTGPIVIRFMVLERDGWHPYVTATWQSTGDRRGVSHPDNIPSASMFIGGREQLRGKQLKVEFDIKAPQHTFGYSVEFR